MCEGMKYTCTSKKCNHVVLNFEVVSQVKPIDCLSQSFRIHEPLIDLELMRFLVVYLIITVSTATIQYRHVGQGSCLLWLAFCCLYNMLSEHCTSLYKCVLSLFLCKFMLPEHKCRCVL